MEWTGEREEKDEGGMGEDQKWQSERLEDGLDVGRGK